MSASYTQPPPPATPSISSLPILNATIVSKSGNDATGLVNRFDKPFLTFAAANAAVAAYYNGIIAPVPSATNPVGIIGYPGYYNEALILQNYVNYIAPGAIIEDTSGANTIWDNGINCNCSIDFFQILRGGTFSPNVFAAIKTTGNSNLLINAYLISSTSSRICDVVAGSSVVINSSFSTFTAATSAFKCDGLLKLNTNINISGIGGLIDGNGVIEINGNITTTSTGRCIFPGSSGYVYTINGNITASGASANVIYNNNTIGTININGNIAGTNITGNGILINDNVTLTINGNVSIGGSANEPIKCTQANAKIILNNARIQSTSNNANVLAQTAGILVINGCTLLPNGTGKDTTAGSTIKLYGTNQTPDLVGAGATYQVGSLIRDVNVI